MTTRNNKMKLPDDLINKTIKSIDSTTSNVWAFTFTDNTHVEIWTECSRYGIPYLIFGIDGEFQTNEQDDYKE